jgi:hypothetical protein
VLLLQNEDTAVHKSSTMAAHVPSTSPSNDSSALMLLIYVASEASLTWYHEIAFFKACDLNYLKVNPKSKGENSDYSCI